MLEKLKKIPIFYVFTKEYRKETEYIENLKNMLPFMKLKSNDFDVDDALKPLIKSDFKSNFSIKVGELK